MEFVSCYRWSLHHRSGKCVGTKNVCVNAVAITNAIIYTYIIYVYIYIILIYGEFYKFPILSFTFSKIVHNNSDNNILI